MTDSWHDISWPASRLAEALEHLARQAGLAPQSAQVPPGPTRADEASLGGWVEAMAARLGLDAESVTATGPDAARLVRGAGPALLRLPTVGEVRYLAVVGCTWRGARLLTPELVEVRRTPTAVQAALEATPGAELSASVEQLLDAAQVQGRRRSHSRRVLLGELRGEEGGVAGWLLRPGGTASLGTQTREAGLPRMLAFLLLGQLGALLLFLTSWWLLGQATLRGQVEVGWLLAWALLLLTLLPFRLLATAAGGSLAIHAGALLKRRLLAGALKLLPDEVRQLGIGQLLGRVLESEVAEKTAVAGGVLLLTATVELVLACVVLVAAGSLLLLLFLVVAGLAAVGLAYRYYRQRRHWTAERLELTHELVEQMVGHRTRLAQEDRRCWNEREDRSLEQYLRTARQWDGRGVALQVLVPRGWFLLGLVGLSPLFLTGPGGAAGLPLAVAGLVLAGQGFRHLVDGLEQLSAAAIAWERIRFLWQAADRAEALAQPALLPAASVREKPAPDREGPPLLDARDLVFRYPGREQAVLQGVSLRVSDGERLLLEGPSGGGKSTLGALLAAGRQPEGGLLLLHGLDQATLGARGWRQRVVLAPQFHDNHVLMGTFAWNVLLGRDWPPTMEDLGEAERICRAVGLGPLLERMPAGLHQVVGETGWQLSHGEKSRLYLARALLQRADVLILDESFGALDPETLHCALAFVLEQAPTLLVIAHP